MLVTHDRYMLDRVCTQVLGVSGTGACRLVADYHQWQRALASLRAPADKPAKPDAKPKPAPQKQRTRRLSNYERRELEGIEDAIAAAEAQVAELQAQAVDNEVLMDHDRMTAVYAALEAAQAKVDALYARWEELEAIDQAYQQSTS